MSSETKNLVLKVAAILFLVWAALQLISVIVLFSPIVGWMAWRLRTANVNLASIAWQAWQLNQKAIAALAAMIFMGGVATIGIAMILSEAHGLDFAITSTIGALIITVWLMTLEILIKSEKIMDILKIASKPDELDAFLNKAAGPTIHIDPAELFDACKKQVIGQDRVVREVCNALSRRAKLNRTGKPLAVFMLVGPTGTGKTELAKAMAEHAFEGRLVRFDMNECSGPESAARLIGSPPGYVGSEQGGQLTQAIMTNKSGVVLLDEIEKAHPDLLKVIMGLLDEGRLTEASSGRTADASKFVIILTSNAKQEELAKLVETITDADDLRRAVKDTLRSAFLPEQLARLDEIFCFNKLDRRSVAQIVGKFLQNFAEQCDVSIVRVDNDLLINTILRHEKNSDFGIRELVRLVEKAVLDGMLECREMGFKKVAIEAEGDQVRVRGVDDDAPTDVDEPDQSAAQGQAPAQMTTTAEVGQIVTHQQTATAK